MPDSSLRVAVGLTPIADWPPILEAAKVADELGFDGVGFWDHYHSPKPEWGYICGWSAYGAVAAVTRQIHLVPMVLNNLHYELGVLAKESAQLAIASGGRFELGIGAGDWPESFTAWGRPFPDQATRFALLEETIGALRQLWTGQPVTFAGEHIRLDGATCTPAPPEPPRIVVGCGKSIRLVERAVAFADELNVYVEQPVVDAARSAIDRSGRPVTLSTFVDWSWDKWPSDPKAEVQRIREGVDRVLISLGGADMPYRLRQLVAT